MKMVTRIVLCCVLGVAAVAAGARAQQQGGKSSKSFQTEGVFSNISVGPGGDYGGMQVYLTDADGQFYATVTVAEGVLLPPVLVKVEAEVEQRRIAFELPGEGGGRKFSGTVTADGLTLSEDGQRTFLKRKCS